MHFFSQAFEYIFFLSVSLFAYNYFFFFIVDKRMIIIYNNYNVPLFLTKYFFVHIQITVVSFLRICFITKLMLYLPKKKK